MFVRVAILPIMAGVVLGVLAPVLVSMGNPGNMGMCAACFTRDIAGSIGLHHTATLQYIRPEIIGIVLGALIASLIFGEFKARGGSAPILRFGFGVFGMIGALVFLGCPWRMILRLSGGDLSALAGLGGLVIGILCGLFFIKRGFSLSASTPKSHFVGLIFPAFMVLLFVLLLLGVFGESSIVAFSQKGPGSMHAPLFYSLVAGLVLGAVLQKSRFCTVAAVRNVVFTRDYGILQGVLTFFITALVLNVALGFFHLGFENQPIAHNDTFWNFLSMVLCGLCFSIGGGCPGRQLVLAGEGNSDSAIFIFGLLFGAALAHNFALASSPNGITENAPIAVILGLVFCVLVALFAKKN
ncbi:YedE family putative selenium transporter [Helicobacter himalayensis]|uniref:YedE family putative selenium transporter n=1 Tax=Helicobacter himalayensis TaxID=1591088 RepID=UPI003D6DFBD5